MRSAITVCLVPEARRGPFVFHEGLGAGAASASALGFDAIEIFPPDAAAIDPTELAAVLERHGLGVAAFGTGGGWLRQGLSLTADDSGIRDQAVNFIQSMIRMASVFRAPVIIGSMQGKGDQASGRAVALERLQAGLRQLSDFDESIGGAGLLYEPLNRYETQLFNRSAEAAAWLDACQLPSTIRVLADLFHMNIEETSLADALRETGARLGHIHFADSNRRAVGLGHIDLSGVRQALEAVNYDGYLSAEVLPLPDSHTAAAQTIESIRRFLA